MKLDFIHIPIKPDIQIKYIFLQKKSFLGDIT